MKKKIEPTLFEDFVLNMEKRNEFIPLLSYQIYLILFKNSTLSLKYTIMYFSEFKTGWVVRMAEGRAGEWRIKRVCFRQGLKKG